MLGLLSGLVAGALLLGQSPAGPGWHDVDVNGSAVPIWGTLEGERLLWSVDEQRFSPTAPRQDYPAVSASAKSRYRIAINEAPCEVRGWVDDSGLFNWVWSDQRRKLSGPSKPEAKRPTGAMANGVDSRKLDASGSVRASDPATAREALSIMDNPPDCPDPGGIKPPPLAGFGLDWQAIGTWAFVVLMIGAGFVFAFGAAVYIARSPSRGE
jgi:hypothetical protein